jgi:uncharacterized surface protein with fasciclin (FAS1) repeats
MRLLLTLALSSLLFLTGCPEQPTNTANNMNADTPMNTENGNNSMTDNSDMSNMNDNSSENPMVGGAEMLKTRNIVENASNSKDHTTLVAAVKAAGLAETLSSPGPFTVFAPTNAAFEKLPEGTVDTLLKAENKDMLKGILTYHVVAGSMDAKAVAAAIKEGGGKATLKTVNGEELTASMDGDKVVITDAKGGKATVTTADVYQSNGVIHVIDAVLMPSK